LSPSIGDFRDDYSPREVEAAKRVMTEIWQVLGEYRDAMVLVGGWIPGLLIADGSTLHTGSLDVDVLLDPDLLREPSGMQGAHGRLGGVLAGASRAA
jgi:hypothetical protein